MIATLQDLLEALADAIVIVDRQGEIVFANGRAEALFGYPSGALTQQSIEVLVPAPLREGHVRHRQNYEQNRRPG